MTRARARAIENEVNSLFVELPFDPLETWLLTQTEMLCVLSYQGKTVSVLDTGVPRLACLRPAAWLKWWQYGPSSSTQAQDPREGPSLTGWTTQGLIRGLASSGWLPRGGEFYARCTSRGSADVSHDDQGQAGASGRRAPVSYLVQGRQATGTESRGISQRFPFWCNKTKTTRTTGQRSSPSPPQRHDQGLFAGKDHFSQDKLYYLSPFKSGRCGIPSGQHLGRGPRPL